MMPVICIPFFSKFARYASGSLGKSGILLLMNITIRLFAVLRQFGPDEQVAAFPEGTAVDDVISALRLPGTIRLLRIVNGEHRPGDYVLKDGDELALFPPIAGG
ncbi:MAG TPA: MoaD/ThiS family protein [Nitrospirota bacterium]|nr:MoaD/ThiS family protein [Nitrospirota bacterium]